MVQRRLSCRIVFPVDFGAFASGLVASAFDAKVVNDTFATAILTVVVAFRNVHVVIAESVAVFVVLVWAIVEAGHTFDFVFAGGGVLG